MTIEVKCLHCKESVSEREYRIYYGMHHDCYEAFSTQDLEDQLDQALSFQEMQG